VVRCVVDWLLPPLVFWCPCVLRAGHEPQWQEQVYTGACLKKQVYIWAASCTSGVALYTGHPAQKAGLCTGHLLQEHVYVCVYIWAIWLEASSVYGPPALAAAKPGLFASWGPIVGRVFGGGGNGTQPPTARQDQPSPGNQRAKHRLANSILRWQLHN
jgi:hypothetical protein